MPSDLSGGMGQGHCESGRPGDHAPQPPNPTHDHHPARHAGPDSGEQRHHPARVQAAFYQQVMI